MQLNFNATNKSKLSVECLLEEKISIEKRLKALGYDGDCAYEKAMVAFYTERLKQCCALLENIQ
ncbi:MAG: hypothetical protein P8Y20_04720 [Gammaproteobacteria bacterium]